MATNKYKGECGTCGTPVAPGAGTVRKTGGRWVTSCHRHGVPTRTYAQGCDCRRPNCNGCDDTYDAMRDAHL